MTYQMEASNHAINMKLSQIRNIMKQRANNAEYIKSIFQTGLDINYSIKSTPYLESKHPNLIGSTALHLALIEDFQEELETILGCGVDPTIKNRNGLTVLHQNLENIYNSEIELFEKESLIRIETEYAIEKMQYATLILSAQSNFKNFKNPCNNHGLSHFHLACLSNDSKLVKSFLEHEILVNHCVAMDSPIFPGYSPIHFAVNFCGFETIKVLMDFGADINLKNKEGMTPLHLIVARKINYSYPTSTYYTQLEEDLNKHDRVIHLFLQNNHDFGELSLFHVACTIKDSSFLERMINDGVDINLRIDQNSIFWPGYTGLHFAAICNIENLILLLKRGADIEIKNEAGQTPFDICQKRYLIKDLHKILSHVKICKDIILSDNKTTFLELVDAMENSEKLNAFFTSSPKRLSAFIPTNSPIWPGYTALHIAMQIKCCGSIITSCFESSNDFTTQTVNGSTGFHLAFRQNNWDIIESQTPSFLKLPNLKDFENLSILHIASVNWSFEFEEYLDNIPQNSEDLNIAYEGKPIGLYLRKGFTPLHVAVVVEGDEIVSKLLEKNADPYIADSEGFTPIHWILATSEEISDSLGMDFLKTNDVRDVVVSGLSHLHVASYISEDYHFLDDSENFYFIKQLLEKPETNVNGVVVYDKKVSPKFLAKFAGATPLSLAMQRKNWKIAAILIKAGADILAKGPDGLIPLYEALNLAENNDEISPFTSFLIEDKIIFRKLEEDINFTKLHLACFMNEMNGIENLLNNGEKLNVQINTNSPLWPGWTPLHILVRYGIKYSPIEEILRELDLEFDINLQNADGDTAIHMAYKYRQKDWLYHLFRRQNFIKNPVNNENFSHFHVACATTNFYAVENFLKSGVVEINGCIDPFLVGDEAGKSPLHLALNTNCSFNDEGPSIGIVDLLLKNGADVNITDALGETSLHKAVRLGMANFQILKNIMDAGADIKAINVYGATALDLLIFAGNFSAEQLEIFIKHGCRFNNYNPIDKEGCISQIFVNHGSRSEEKKILFNLMLEHPLTVDTDEKGRTAIHNLVANNSTSLFTNDYVDLISQLVTITGCDIDDQDDKGRTALFLAAHHKNKNAIKGLLISGADVNMIDNFGDSVFEYQSGNNIVFSILNKHVRLLEMLNLNVSQKNKAFVRNDIPDYVMKEILTEFELAKSVEIIASSLTLYDFFFENSTKAISSLMVYRNRIENFFRDFNDKRFVYLIDLYKLQYRKALMRPVLIEQASIAFHNISGCPMECVEFIVKLLANYELRSLIKAEQIG